MPRTHYVVDPPDGILPYQPWAFERRNSVLRNYTKPERWQLDPQTLAWPGANMRVNTELMEFAGVEGETAVARWLPSE